VEGFDYAPKPAFAVSVDVYNEKNEYDTLKRFFSVIIEYKPIIITSFNGDRFDWPFIENRCNELDLNLDTELGIKKSEETGEYFGRFLSHLDCFPWVERDAYLP
jgi:DNA polymerase epsilon subunit 1